MPIVQWDIVSLSSSGLPPWRPQPEQQRQQQQISCCLYQQRSGDVALVPGQAGLAAVPEAAGPAQKSPVTDGTKLSLGRFYAVYGADFMQNSRGFYADLMQIMQFVPILCKNILQFILLYWPNTQKYANNYQIPYIIKTSYEQIMQIRCKLYANYMYIIIICKHMQIICSTMTPYAKNR